MRMLAPAIVLALAATACTIEAVTPEPGPTVTVTATERVTEAPTPAVDACGELVGGDSLAFIFVTSPVVGQHVQSGFTFEGCSNSFEGTYVWRLLDAAGQVLASGFGTATCGTGCVGTIQQPVTFTTPGVQVGTLQVFSESAQDGSEQDLNSIPLVLEP